jgi:hypothetical protein
MKAYPMVFLLVLVFFSCRKKDIESTFIFKSTVVDKVTGRPVANAPVELLNCTSSLMSSRSCDSADVAYTNASGEFRFEIPTKNPKDDGSGSHRFTFRVLASENHASSEEFNIEKGKEFNVPVSSLVNKKLILSYNKNVFRTVVSLGADPVYSALLVNETQKKSYDLKFSSNTNNYITVSLLNQNTDIVAYSDTIINPTVNDTSAIYMNLQW